MPLSNKRALKRRPRGKVRKRRTFTGCETCRKRKIKCDGKRPACVRCEKSKLLCSGYDIKLRYVELLTILNDGTLGHVAEAEKSTSEAQKVRRRQIPYTKFPSFCSYKYFEEMDSILNVIDSLSYKDLPVFNCPFGCFLNNKRYGQNIQSNLETVSLQPTIEEHKITEKGKLAPDYNFIHPTLQSYALLTYRIISASTNSNIDVENWCEIQQTIFPELCGKHPFKNRIVDRFKKQNYELGDHSRNMVSMILEAMDDRHKDDAPESKVVQMVIDCSITQDLIRTFLKHSTTMMHLSYKHDLFETIVIPLLYKTVGQSFLFNSFVMMGDHGDITTADDYQDMDDSQFEDFCRLIKQTFVITGLSVATLSQLRVLLFNDLGIFQDSSVYLNCFIGFREISMNNLAQIIQIVTEEHSDKLGSIKLANEKLLNRIVTAGLIKELLLCLIYGIKQDEMVNILHNYNLLFNTTSQICHYVRSLKYSDKDLDEILLWFRYMFSFFKSTSLLKLLDPGVNEYDNTNIFTKYNDLINKDIKVNSQLPDDTGEESLGSENMLEEGKGAGFPNTHNLDEQFDSNVRASTQEFKVEKNVTPIFELGSSNVPSANKNKLIYISSSLGADNSQISSVEIGYGVPLTLLELLEKIINLAEHREDHKVNSKLYGSLENELINWKLPWDLSIKSPSSSSSIETHEILYHLAICSYNSILLYYFRLIKNAHPSLLQNYVITVLTHLEQLTRLHSETKVEYKLSLPFWCCLISGSEARGAYLQSSFENLFSSWHDGRDKWIGKQVMMEVWKCGNRSKMADTSWIDIIKRYEVFGLH